MQFKLLVALLVLLAEESLRMGSFVNLTKRIKSVLGRPAPQASKKEARTKLSDMTSEEVKNLEQNILKEMLTL